MESGKEPMESPILASGKIQRRRDMECTSGETATNMKVNGNAASEAVMVAISSLTEMCSLVNMLMVNQKALANISGLTVAVTLANSAMD